MITQIPVSVTFHTEFESDRIVVAFHKKGMKEEDAELMFADHENNVFVFTEESEIPYNVFEYDKADTDTFDHVVFLQYEGEGVFEICSRTWKFSITKLRNAFQGFGFKNPVEYRSYAFRGYVRLSEKDTFNVMLKHGK